jgi:hypothetical protein
MTRHHPDVAIVSTAMIGAERAGRAGIRVGRRMELSSMPHVVEKAISSEGSSP